MPVELLYAANPMCSWCWGFAPVMGEITRRHGGRVRITTVLGALGRGDAPMRPEDKAAVRAHWEHVQARTGQPFDFSFFDRETFVYDTEPACRAVAVVRAQRDVLVLPYLAAVQEAFYTRNGDVTQPSELQRLAEGLGVDGAAFAEAFAAPEMRAAVAQEFADVARLGVTGYPTLLGLTGGRATVLSLGCQPAAEVETALEALLAASAG
jgi:putative protein-disulfide isomerase